MGPNNNIATSDENERDGIKILTQTTVNSQPDRTLTKEECQLDAMFRAMMTMMMIILIIMIIIIIAV